MPIFSFATEPLIDPKPSKTVKKKSAEISTIFFVPNGYSREDQRSFCRECLNDKSIIHRKKRECRLAGVTQESLIGMH